MNACNNNITIKDNTVYLTMVLSGIFMVGIYYYSIVRMGIVDHDSWANIMRAREGINDFGIHLNRVGNSIMGYLEIPQRYSPNIAFYRLFTCVGTVLSAMVYAKLGSLIAKEKKGYVALYFVLFFLMAQYRCPHNGLWAFSWTYQVASFFFGASMVCFYRWLESNDKLNKLIISVFLYVLAMMTYELYVPMGLFFFLLEIDHYGFTFEWKSVIRLVNGLKWHFLVAVVYAFIWYLPMLVYPSVSMGDATIGGESTSLRGMLSTLFSFGFAMFPLSAIGYLPEQVADVLNKADGSDIMIVVLIIGVAFACCIQIGHCQSISEKKYLFISAFSFLGILVSNALIAMVEKFQIWHSHGTRGFGTSYHSYFFIVLWITVTAVYISGKVEKTLWARWLFRVLGVVVFSLIGIATYIDNESIVDEYHQDYVRIATFDKFLETEDYESIPEGSQVYMPQFIGLYENVATLGDYAKEVKGKGFTSVNTKDDLDFSHNVYYYLWDEDNEAVYFAKMRDERYADAVSFFAAEELRNKSISFHRNSDDLSVKVDGVEMGFYGDNYVVTPCLGIDLNRQKIQAKGISPESLVLDEKVHTCNSIIQWDDYGFNYQTMGRCAPPRSTMYINNFMNLDSCHFTFNYQLMGESDSAILTVVNKGSDSSYDISHEGLLDIDIPLHEGENHIDIILDGEDISIQEEDREYAVFVGNIVFQYGENQFDLSLANNW